MAGVSDWYLEGDRVLVKPDKMGEMSEGKLGAKLYIPESAAEARSNMGTTGELVQVGPAADLCRNMPDGDKVTITNDMLPMKVIHAKYGGMMVEVENPDELDRLNRPVKVKYRIMRDDDIAMFVEDDDA